MDDHQQRSRPGRPGHSPGNPEQGTADGRIILGGSRAVGDHRPDSDVDLTAIAPDDDSAKRTEEILQELLEGKQDVPVVNVHTITRAEFSRLALQAQSFPGQAARYGVTPEGRSLHYRPERNPTSEEIQELTLLWLGLAGSHMSLLKFLLEEKELCHVKCLGKDAQWGLERAFKGLLAAGNDPIWFRRDAAFLWRHVESVQPIADREGAWAMENLLAATTGPDGNGCSLTAFTEAYRRGTEYPGMSDGRTGGGKALDKACNRRPDNGGAGPVGSAQGESPTGKA